MLTKQKLVGLVRFNAQQPLTSFLAGKIERAGYRVVHFEPRELLSKKLGKMTLIVNLNDEDDATIDQLLDYAAEQQAQLIINDADVSKDLAGLNKKRWARHILHKIDSNYELLPIAVKQQDTESAINLLSMGIRKVWILAASIGGPESLARFLSAFNGKEPVLFVIAQHMDAEFVPMMAKQLNKNGKIEVMLPHVGERIKAAQAILAPVNEALLIRPDGTMGVKDLAEKKVSTPCIDDVCFDMIEQLEHHLNIAVFSGMATDGVKGAIAVHDNGGTIITQSAESCVLSSIADEIRQQGYSKFVGDPDEMADYVKQNL